MFLMISDENSLGMSNSCRFLKTDVVSHPSEECPVQLNFAVFCKCVMILYFEKLKTGITN